MFKVKTLNLHEPKFCGNEIKYLTKCINTTQVSSAGPFSVKFENMLRKFTKSKYVVTVINGTSAIHISLIASGLKKNDEVLIPTLNYVASSNSVLYCGAKPHFIDCSKNNLGIDIVKLQKYLSKNTKIKKNSCFNKKTGKRIHSIIPTHVFGHVENIDLLVMLANKFKLKVIEDASEGIGSFYKKKHAGTFGNLGVLSFNGNKTLTTGGGGAILTNNYSLAKQCRHLTMIAKKKHAWSYDYDQLGYNYKMPSINAALGCAQLENINLFLKFKRNLFKLYNSKFDKIDEVYLYKEPKNCLSNYWLQTLVLKNPSLKTRDEILNYLNSKNIKVRPIWKLMHKINYLKNFQSMNLDNAIEMEKKIINIPSGTNLFKTNG